MYVLVATKENVVRESAYIYIYAGVRLIGRQTGPAQGRNTDGRVKSVSVRGRVRPVFATAAGGKRQ